MQPYRTFALLGTRKSSAEALLIGCCANKLPSDRSRETVVHACEGLLTADGESLAGLGMGEERRVKLAWLRGGGDAISG